jgi:hypothetical protein
MSDRLGSTLSFFGRLADDFRREPAWQGEYRVTLLSPPTEALYKQDGHFAFADLPPSPTDYQFALLDGLYQGRLFQKAMPVAAPVEIAYDGEDEVYLFVKTVNAAAQQITFDAIPFLPVVRSGAAVLAQGGAATTLAEDLAGVDVTTAVLTDVTGLLPGQLVRIVRSHCLRGKAGPYYPFPAGTTVLLLRVVEDTPEQAPIAGAQAHLDKLNAITPSSATVAGAALRYVPLGGPGGQQPVLGTDADLDAFTEARGNAVFYFPGQLPLTSLELAVSAAGYVSSTAVFPLVAGQTTSATVKLAAV